VCANYEPVTLQDRLLAHFGVARPENVEPPEFTFPGYFAPFIVKAEHRDSVVREGMAGRYGLLPHWADKLAFGRHTYNCRSETAATKPSFREAWKKGRHCVIPAERLFEQCYETGVPVRWAIVLRAGGPMGLAGLWGMWIDPKSGERIPTFTMLTVNADGHGVFGRMHPPNDEKRMPVILDPDQFDPWLECLPEHAMSFMKQYPAERLEAYPAPLERKAKSEKLPRAKPKTKEDEPPEDPNGDLFG
jgi:putative SOS response-associated peptidase YedK